KAIEPDGVAALVILVRLHDRNHNDPASIYARIFRRLKRTTALVLVVRNVLFNIGIRRYLVRIHLRRHVIVEACVQSLSHCTSRDTGFGINFVDLAWRRTSVDSSSETNTNVLTT